jgi:hypothetical protein
VPGVQLFTKKLSASRRVSFFIAGIKWVFIQVEAELFGQVPRDTLYWTQVHLIVCNGFDRSSRNFSVISVPTTSEPIRERNRKIT